MTPVSRTWMHTVRIHSTFQLADRHKIACSKFLKMTHITRYQIMNTDLIYWGGRRDRETPTMDLWVRPAALSRSPIEPSILAPLEPSILPILISSFKESPVVRVLLFVLLKESPSMRPTPSPIENIVTAAFIIVFKVLFITCWRVARCCILVVFIYKELISSGSWCSECCSWYCDSCATTGTSSWECSGLIMEYVLRVQPDAVFLGVVRGTCVLYFQPQVMTTLCWVTR